MALNATFKAIKPNRLITTGCRRLATGVCDTCVDVQDEMPAVEWNKYHLGPRTHYGGRYTATLLPGMGIGPELMGYVKEIFRHIGAPIDFEEINMDMISHNSGDLYHAVTSVIRNGIALKSNISPCNSCQVDNYSPTDNHDDALSTTNAKLRKRLDLFVNTVHCKSFPGLPQRHEHVDVLVVRQNTEGEYAMHEHENVKGVVESMKVVTRVNAERVIRYAFESAVLHKRKKVTTVHKANIMKLSDGLFLDISREIARDYPSIVHDDMIVDAACMRLISNPRQFDVILTTNLYGSIVSNILCAMVGGAGLVSGKNVGEFCTSFEPATRSSGFEIAGLNLANPIAMLNAAADMLAHLGQESHAQLIQRGIEGCIRDKVWTKDLGGTATSREVVDCILRHIDVAIAES
ncbi:isocitrate dehydrogenase [NAD] subunit gamma, mitochondrial-like [Copidosoma floridanum]|uniref:isocitrate dehydrogenase [NAD] subunit gamma, mitochondrial-like n=1 Tax=Copidosoma floridanum TaxID=29053 RepID=UPI0006C9783E|nr:isocitrate dehydrogenase [NAD] subunit gamma, mitochondrial-like [Copidosoma floridanum]